MLLMLMLFHLFNALWEMYVFYQQWTLIFDNVTANEYLNGTKYARPASIPHPTNSMFYR